MKAPEKIYLHPDLDSIFGMTERSCESEIEYVRTDAFIEKADKFLSSFFHPDNTELKKYFLDEFHKYMKGE